MDLVDINAYTPEWPFRRLRHRTVGDVLRLMDAAGIARAVVSPLGAAFRLDVPQANEELLQFISAHRDRLAPAFAVNPSYPGWEADLEAALESRAAALRLYPGYHGYAVGDTACVEAVRRAAEAGLPVLVAARLQDERSHHPMMQVPPLAAEQLEELAAPAPQAAIVATMMRASEAEAAAGTPNLVFDLSFMQGPVGFLPPLVEALGAGRLLLGTNLPLQYPLPSAEKVLSAPSPEVREAIGWRNALRLLPGAWES